MRIDSNSKKTFVVTTRNMDPILSFDARAPYNEEDANEELLLYRPLNSPVVNILKVSKHEDRTYTLSYCEMVEEGGAEGDEDIQSYNEITLKPGQLKMIQSIFEFAIPAISGLHALYNPAVIN